MSMLDAQQTLNARADLVTASAVQGISGLRYDAIRKLVDGGDFFHPGFVWVWNFAVRSDGERDLRFWTREVIAPETCGDLGLGDVLEIILPASRKHFHAGEVMRMFSLTPTSLMRLRDQLGGRLESSGSFYSRDNIDNFLRTRWCGVQANNLVASGGTPPAPVNGTSRRQHRQANPKTDAGSEKCYPATPARKF